MLSAGTGDEPSRLRRWLRILVAFVTILSAAATGLFLSHLRQSAMADARTRSTDAALLLEEHIVRTFRSSDFIVGRVAELGRSRPMPALAADERAWRELKALDQGLPEPGSLWVIDGNGQVRLSTLAFPAAKNNVLDRHYFYTHMAERRDVVIGPLVQTKLSGIQAFHFSRRIESPNGTFLGVAAAAFNADTFTNFYKTLPLGPKAAITVIDLEGRVILRQPDPERWANGSVSGGALIKRLAEGEPTGTMISVSPLDQVERMLAYRLIPEFGVVVVTAIATEDILAGWWRSVWIAATVAIMLAIVLSALVRVTFSSLSREEALVRGLEAAVRERTGEARAQAEEARRANESKTRFLAAASHDLRQPLQAAGMFVEALAARMENSPHSALVDKLRQSVDATQSLLTTLLDVSTLEAGRIQPHVSPFTLMPILANLCDQAEPDAAAKHLELTVVSTTARVVSDPVLLERLLRNLLVNAIRYTETGGVVLGCRRRGGHLAICVIDSGIGIPADKLDAVFDDFTRLDANPGSRGLGLGLGVVRRMARLLRHDVELRSIHGKGSCFAVIVPLAPSL